MYIDIYIYIYTRLRKGWLFPETCVAPVHVGCLCVCVCACVFFYSRTFVKTHERNYIRISRKFKDQSCLAVPADGERG